MESREALFDIPFVVYRVGSSGRESKANHPQTLIPLMIMEINLGSPQHASVAAPFHFSFHRCNDVPRVCVCVCLSFRLSRSFLLAPLAFSSLFLTRPPPRMHAHVLADRCSLSLSLSRALCLLLHFQPLFVLLFSPLPPSRFFFIFASPRLARSGRANRFSLPRSLFRVLLTCQSCAFDEYVER